MNPFKWISELWEWIVALPPDFAFLLSLPLMVVIAAFARDAVCRVRKAVKDP